MDSPDPSARIPAILPEPRTSCLSHASPKQTYHEKGFWSQPKDFLAETYQEQESPSRAKDYYRNCALSMDLWVRIIDWLDELHSAKGLLIEMMDFLRIPTLSKELIHQSFYFFEEPLSGKGLLIKIIDSILKHCKTDPSPGPEPWFLESGA